MKRNKYIIGAMSLLLATTAFTACEDQPDKFELTGGKPEITYVRLPLSASADSLITGAYMDNTICLVGKNLTSIRELYFNDQPAILNTSFITDHTLLVDVPGELPGVVSDKIYMITKGRDTVTYDFSVLVPAPTVASMSNEYAKPGEEITIYGDYFIDDPNVPLAATMPDGKPLVIKSFSKYQIVADIPAGSTESGFITVQSVYGKSRSKFQFHDERGMLFDFDGSHGGFATGHGWRSGMVHSDGTDNWSALDGDYLYFGGVAFGGDAGSVWPEDQFCINYWPEGTAEWPALSDIPVLKSMLTNYSLGNLTLKFEILIPSAKPWGSQAMQLMFTGNDDVTYATANNGYYGATTLGRALWMPWTPTEMYDTGDKWITVSTPLSTFTKTNEGANAASGLNLDKFTGFTIFVWHGGVNGQDCETEMAIDNIRVVPIE